jgi:hypothetical protein
MADNEHLPDAAPVLELLNGFRKSKVSHALIATSSMPAAT